ncbi:MAG: hypothetical protein ABR880_11585 [Candidatus Sulfotelmatobacter sp.]|jgi:hypothetical protein
MKALTLALLLTTVLSTTLCTAFSVTTAKPAAHADRRLTGQVEQHSKSGRWYFAATGHAVYCYGPVMTLPQANGDLQKVATFCRDGRAVVPLKD